MSNCWQSSAGTFFNAQPMTPAPKVLTDGRSVSARAVPAPSSGFAVEVNVNGLAGLVNYPPNSLAGLGIWTFQSTSQVQFMVVPNASKIVVKYTTGTNPAALTVDLFVVDLSGGTPYGFPLDIGNQPINPLYIDVGVHPSRDGRLLFTFVRVGNSSPITHATHFHRVTCMEDYTVLCEHPDLTVYTNPPDAMRAVLRGARVKVDRGVRFIEMIHANPVNITIDPLEDPGAIVFKQPPCSIPFPGLNRVILITAINSVPNTSERVVLENLLSISIDMTGWTIKDRAGHTFDFPAGYVFPSRGVVTVWTSTGSNTQSNLYWNLNMPIWNDSGDEGTLFYPDNEPASRFVYTMPTSTMPPESRPRLNPSDALLAINSRRGRPTIYVPAIPKPTARPEIFDESFHIVDAVTSFINANRTVEEGYTLLITASGDIWTTVGQGNGPNGWDENTGLADSGYPLPGAPRYSLVGYIGQTRTLVNRGPKKFIGSDLKWKIKNTDLPSDPQSPRLLILQINDDMLSDNAGEFYVRVQYQRDTFDPRPNLSNPVDSNFTLTNGSAELDTGIVLGRGDQIQIRATGTYTPGGIFLNGGATNANGWDERAIRDSRFPLGHGELAHKFALLYRFGTCPYYLYAGESQRDTYFGSPTSLFLRINDDVLGGESGGYSVTVSVRRRL